MKGYETDLNNLVEVSHSLAESKGFWDNDRNVGELLALIHAEISEALEGHRAGNHITNEGVIKGLKIEDEEKFKEYVNKYVKDTFENEMADAVIRIFDLCGGFGIDLVSHINLKLKYNSTREKKHGKKY